MSGPRFRGATVGIPAGIPILGQPKPVGMIRIGLMDDGSTSLQIAGSPDAVDLMMVRLFRVVLLKGAEHVTADAPPEPVAQGDGDSGE